jgi:hypothetical protein
MACPPPLPDATVIPLGTERDMTPDEFAAWYDRLKSIDPTLTQVKLAKLLDVDQPRIGKWMRGKVAISGYLWRALRDLERELLEANVPKSKKRRRTGATNG